MYNYIIVITMCLVQSLQLVNADNPSAFELLDKYSKTQDSLQRFIIKSEDSATNESTVSGGVKEHSFFSSELRFDGDRSSYRNTLWGGFAAGKEVTPKEEARYQSFLWDGKNYYQYSTSPTSKSRPHGLVTIDHSKKYAEKLFSRGYSGGILFGYSQGDEKRIDLVLREAESIDVEKELAPIAKSLCYVINATTPYGKYKVWLDPEHGHNIAKMEVRKDTGDLMYGHPMSNKAKYSGSLENVRFEKIDDLWLPVEATISYNRIFNNGDFYKSVSHHKRTEIILNPDFASLNSFVPDDIENGAEVRDLAVKGITYAWQDGKLIPNIDEAALDQLDKMAGEITAEDDAKPALPRISSVSDLLNRYRISQEKISSFIAKSQSAIEKNGRNQETTSEFRFDGDRVCHRVTSWDNLTEMKENPGYNSFLWDGKSLITYRTYPNTGTAHVFISKDKSGKEGFVSNEYKGAPLLGYCPGDYKRIDLILAGADDISLREKTEAIGESKCYVIDAQTKCGKYGVWIDPDHGYNIAKIEVQRKKGDLVWDHARAKTDMSFSLNNVRFDQIDTVWVPMEADMKQIDDSQSKTVKWHHKRTEMILNPDHEALRSFVADDIPDGMKVSISGDQSKYIWQNGKPAAQVKGND